jgi:nickel-type superoxide dismutase maturation protease
MQENTAMEQIAKEQPRRWQVVTVLGDSMFPTLRDGDQVLVARSKRFSPGQIVMFHDPSFRLAIKRLQSCELESWIVEGDNQENSIDSRNYGLVSESDIQGVVLMRLWPRPGGVS